MPALRPAATRLTPELDQAWIAKGVRRSRVWLCESNLTVREGVYEMQETYNYKVVRQFAVMAVVWGILGMAMGVFIAAQLVWPDMMYGIEWMSYGRLRPLHTNSVIFAFGGCALFATSYYVVQRTCHTRIFSDRLAAFTFWGWQAVIVAAEIGRAHV